MPDSPGKGGGRFCTGDSRGCDGLMAGNAIPNFSRVGFLNVLLHKGARVEVEHQSRSSDTISASVLLPGLIFATGLPGFSFFPFQSANPERTKFWIRSSRDPEAGIIRPTSTPRSVMTTVFPAFMFLMYSLRWILSSRIPTLFSAIRTTPPEVTTLYAKSTTL